MRYRILTSIGHSYKYIAVGQYAKLHESAQCNVPDRSQSVINVNRLKCDPVN